MQEYRRTAQHRLDLRTSQGELIVDKGSMVAKEAEMKVGAVGGDVGETKVHGTENGPVGLLVVTERCGLDVGIGGEVGLPVVVVHVTGHANDSVNRSALSGVILVSADE